MIILKSLRTGLLIRDHCEDRRHGLRELVREAAIRTKDESESLDEDEVPGKQSGEPGPGISKPIASAYFFDNNLNASFTFSSVVFTSFEICLTVSLA